MNNANDANDCRGKGASHAAEVGETTTINNDNNNNNDNITNINTNTNTHINTN